MHHKALPCGLFIFYFVSAMQQVCMPYKYITFFCCKSSCLQFLFCNNLSYFILITLVMRNIYFPFCIAMIIVFVVNKGELMAAGVIKQLAGALSNVFKRYPHGYHVSERFTGKMNTVAMCRLF